MDASSLETFNLTVTKQQPTTIQVNVTCKVADRAGELPAVWARLRGEILSLQCVAGFGLAQQDDEQASLQVDRRRSIIASLRLTKVKG